MTTLSDDVRSFLSQGTRTGKLAWVAPDGRPLVTPIWFVVDGDDLVFNTGAESAKGKAMVGDPRVALVVDEGVPPYGMVQVQGEVEVSVELDTMLRFATQIGKRYMGAARAEEFGRRNAVTGELLVRLRPTKVIAHFDATA